MPLRPSCAGAPIVTLFHARFTFTFIDFRDLFAEIEQSVYRVLDDARNMHI